MAVEAPVAYKAYLEKLSEVSGVEIRKFADLIDALKVRHAFFGEAGCRLSDHMALRNSMLKIILLRR